LVASSRHGQIDIACDFTVAELACTSLPIDLVQLNTRTGRGFLVRAVATCRAYEGNFRRPDSFLNPENQRKLDMTPTKKPASAPPKFGDIVDMIERVDRLGNVEATVARVERKLEDLVRMMTPLFGDLRTRTAVQVALTTESLRALRK
jgi:hypothetical protein